MIHRGDFSQSQFNNYNTHDAGVWQTIEGLTPGQTVEFTVWVRIWSSACNDSCFSPLEPCPGGGGNSNGNYDVAVGIDPTGGTPTVSVQGATSIIPPATVQWAWQREPLYDEFIPLTIRTQAQGTKVTVYTRGTVEWAVSNNFSYWDAAELRVLDDGTATPTVESTPYATITPGPSPTAGPTNTAAPTNTATPTSTRAPLTARAYLPYLVVGHALPATPTPTATTPVMASPTPTATAVPSTATPTPTATATTAPPTETATPTATTAPSTETPTPTVTPTATATLIPVVCADPVINGDFESAGGWQFVTGVPYPPGIDTTFAHSGARSLRLGPAGAATEESWSYAWQPVSVPAGATSASLSFWVYRDGGDAHDEIDVELMTAQGVPVRKVLRVQPAAGEWQQVTADLSVWAGSTVQLWFNAYNDGEDSTLTAHIDEVRLEVCGPIDRMSKAPVGLDPDVKLDAPRPPARKTSGVNVHFTWVVYSPEQIGRSRVCPECRTEWAYLENDGDPVDLAGWTITTNRGDRFVFPNLMIDQDTAVRLHSDVGSLTQTDAKLRNGRGTLWDVYWGSTVGLLPNAHDDQYGRLTLTDPLGRQPPASICWGPNQVTPGSCPMP